MISGRSLALLGTLRQSIATEHSTVCKAMAQSTFVSKLNPMTGKMEWQPQNVDYDYHQEIARSAYADMLHDYERNQKYYQGIRKAIDLIHQRGQKANVLDIGTGTGLLSMMAAASGADKITACEAFSPMAACAVEVIRQNGFEGKIKVVPKRSTDLTVGPEGDMAERANLLVTEVFDTELIGEGAIGTFSHAHLELLTEDCLVVPRAANLYAQPVSSRLLRCWNTVHPIPVAPGRVISPPAELSRCGGAASLHDLQLDQLPQSSFVSLHPPVAVFRFDFSKRGALAKERRVVHELVAGAEGESDAVFMWWDLEMDPAGEITLSCAPSWAHPDGKQLPWRDHWMQAIYYPPVSVALRQDQRFRLVSCHDEYSLWFSVHALHQEHSPEEDGEEEGNNVCRCGLHMVVSRTRLGMLNDSLRNSVYIQALKRVVTAESVVLTISDGSLLPLMAALLGARKVFALEREAGCRRLLESFVQANSLEARVSILHQEPDCLTPGHLQDLKVMLVVGEPHFSVAVLPWHAWYFRQALCELRGLLAPEVQVLPRAISIRALGLEFEHLWKIRAPVGRCEGFDISVFDRLIADSSAVADAAVEPQPLWEYPGLALTSPATLTRLAWDAELQSPPSPSPLPVCRAGKLNGVALWTEFDFGEGLTVSTGPRERQGQGEGAGEGAGEGRAAPPDWDMFSRQGVHLLPTPRPVQPGDCCLVHTAFSADEGDFRFDFQLKSSQ